MCFYVSVCLFFNSSRSLLIDSCIFSILFSRFLIIFTIIIFQVNFPISSSFIWTSVFLVCSFICAVFLCLFFLSFFLFLSYCVWGLLFPGFKESWILCLKKVEFFLPFGLCSPKIGPVVCAEFLFVSPLMGKAEWGGDPVCCWLGLYFCFVYCLDEASCTWCYWCLVMLGLVFKWFPLCEFSLFDTP